MGVLLLDDRFVLNLLPEKWRIRSAAEKSAKEDVLTSQGRDWTKRPLPQWRAATLIANSAILIWIFYATTAQLVSMFSRTVTDLSRDRT